MEKQELPRTKPRIGITMGDFNGIGPEVIIKALSDNRLTNHCTPIVYGSGKVLTKYKRILENEQFNYHQFNAQSYLHEKKVNVVNCWPEHVEVEPGVVTQEAGECAYLALQHSTEDLRNGVIDAVVTAPINKANIQREGFEFPGHTEYYARAFGVADNLMMLCDGDLRVAVVTGHVPLAQAPALITRERVQSKLRILSDTLIKDFGIAKPRIAVLGLNPHAGEDGLLGSEERDVLAPLIRDLRQKGQLIFGPLPADGFFGMMQHQKFDAVLAMYHDQGLIPFKTLAFESGVNFTAGLPIIRTSPDHGTAYSIAGKNQANEEAMRQAIFMAIDLVKRRADKVEYKIRKKIDLVSSKE